MDALSNTYNTVDFDPTQQQWILLASALVDPAFWSRATRLVFGTAADACNFADETFNSDWHIVIAQTNPGHGPSQGA